MKNYHFLIHKWNKKIKKAITDISKFDNKRTIASDSTNISNDSFYEYWKDEDDNYWRTY